MWPLFLYSALYSIYRAGPGWIEIRSQYHPHKNVPRRPNCSTKMFHDRKMFHALNKKRLKTLKKSCVQQINPHSVLMTNSSPLVFVVTAPSAISFRQCLLGHGSTKAEAMTDAFGPKPWPRSAKNADCYEVTEEEFEALRAGVNS